MRAMVVLSAPATLLLSRYSAREEKGSRYALSRPWCRVCPTCPGGSLHRQYQRNTSPEACKCCVREGQATCAATGALLHVNILADRSLRPCVNANQLTVEPNARERRWHMPQSGDIFSLSPEWHARTALRLPVHL
jgi:hypothetical protein